MIHNMHTQLQASKFPRATDKEFANDSHNPEVRGLKDALNDGYLGIFVGIPFAVV